MENNDFFFMKEAYAQALLAFELDEVPIGCVIVHKGEVIGRGYNRRNTDKNVLSHAEIIAIDQACKYLNDWRLENCRMYVILEPCPMCAGAILQARIPVLVFGAHNPKAGCAGSIVNLLENPMFNHRVEVISGIEQEACSALMREFFKRRRQ